MRQLVSLCICVLILSNMNISETIWSIATKFYLKHHWGGGKAALGFWARSNQNSGFHSNRKLP